uniref:Uncharacterized protein n=1 Tax=Oryza sativa subsp. japonica TaxID=39947 RepID=Q6Z023_ORYSJ|nr:hypothetical protein [Oryza sativa Japonica Group]
MLQRLLVGVLEVKKVKKMRLPSQATLVASAPFGQRSGGAQPGDSGCFSAFYLAFWK